MIPDDLLRSILSEADFKLLKENQAKAAEFDAHPEEVERIAEKIIQRVETLTAQETRHVIEPIMLDLSMLIAAIKSRVNDPVMFHNLALNLFLFGVAVGKDLATEEWDDLKKRVDEP